LSTPPSGSFHAFQPEGEYGAGAAVGTECSGLNGGTHSEETITGRHIDKRKRALIQAALMGVFTTTELLQRYALKKRLKFSLR
jgi:hypothetical protein